MSETPDDSDLPELSESEIKTIETLVGPGKSVLSNAAGITFALAGVAKRFVDQCEAEKTPEIRAAERAHLYRTFCQRDTWLMVSEAIPLTFGKGSAGGDYPWDKHHPLLALAKSCVGHSLKVANPKDKVAEVRVAPFEWVRWLQEKKQAIPAEFVAHFLPASSSVSTPQSYKTEHAVEERVRQKAARLSSLRAFLSEVDRRALQRKLGWSRQDIPATKADLRTEFIRKHPEYKKSSPASFADDLTYLGAKFRPGIRSSKNNAIQILFTNNEVGVKPT